MGKNIRIISIDLDELKQSIIDSDYFTNDGWSKEDSIKFWDAIFNEIENYNTDHLAEKFIYLIELGMMQEIIVVSKITKSIKYN